MKKIIFTICFMIITTSAYCIETPKDFYLLNKNGHMNKVLISHNKHKNIKCETCHHNKSAEHCYQCHTLNNKKYYNAFHSETSERSCVGCHKKKNVYTTCDTCHDGYEF